MFEDLLQIRTPLVNFYVLRDSKGLYLIDCGFVNGIKYLRRGLVERGWDNDPIIGILVSHGHLDHILNVQSLANETGAWIAAPRLDCSHYEGLPTYQGISKFTGFLEAIGRPLLGFQKFTPSRFLDHGDELDIWHGLTVVHLPGHTLGHTGFYCENLKLLFCADLFASFKKFSHYPPTIFNNNDQEISTSITKALQYDVVGVLPNHCDRAAPKTHLARLVQLKTNNTKATVMTDLS